MYAHLINAPIGICETCSHTYAMYYTRRGPDDGLLTPASTAQGTGVLHAFRRYSFVALLWFCSTADGPDDRCRAGAFSSEMMFAERVNWEPWVKCIWAREGFSTG